MLGDVSADPVRKFGTLAELEVRCCQILLSKKVLANGLIHRIAEITLNDEYEITTVFCGFEGERYDDIPAAQATVGLAPEATRAARLAEMRQVARAARRLGAPAIALHIGYIPPDRKSKLYCGTLKAAQDIADDAAKLGLKLTLETGQEKASHLREFIQDADRDNLWVNFDPANMLLYGNDQPIPALDLLGERLFNVHAKDGDWPARSGKLGEEKPLGRGQVDFPKFVRKLKEVGYRGPLIIEREISGPQQIADMREAISFLKSLVHS